MKKPSRALRGTRAMQPRPIDSQTLASVDGGTVSPPKPWEPEQHNQTLVRDPRRRRRARR